MFHPLGLPAEGVCSEDMESSRSGTGRMSQTTCCRACRLNFSILFAERYAKREQGRMRRAKL